MKLDFGSESFQFDLTKPVDKRDALSPTKRRITELVLVSGFIFLIPLFFSHFTRGNQTLMLTNLIALVLMVLASVLYITNRRQWLPSIWYTLILSLYVLVSIDLQGVSSSYWLFPLLFGNALMARVRFSLPYNLILTAAAVAILWPNAPRALLMEFVSACIIALFVSYGMMVILIELQAQLEKQGFTDQLTGLHNRRFLNLKMRESIQRKRSSTSFGLLVIDIDGFKQVNDQYGHGRGDRVLTDFGQVLNNAKNQHKMMTARAGGEEFVQLLEGCDQSQLAAYAETLRQSIESEFFLPEKRLTASIGASMLESGMTADDWYHQADARLSQAKSQGRNRVVAG